MKIEKEHERRNKAKMMLQAVLVQTFASKEDKKNTKNALLDVQNDNNKNVATFGKLPNYSRGNDEKWYEKSAKKVKKEHVLDGSLLKQTLQRLMKKSRVDKANNQIMQKEYMDRLRKLELSVLRDMHLK